MGDISGIISARAGRRAARRCGANDGGRRERRIIGEPRRKPDGATHDRSGPPRRVVGVA